MVGGGPSRKLGFFSSGTDSESSSGVEFASDESQSNTGRRRTETLQGDADDTGDDQSYSEQIRFTVSPSISGDEQPTDTSQGQSDTMSSRYSALKSSTPKSGTSGPPRRKRRKRR